MRSGHTYLKGQASFNNLFELTEIYTGLGDQDPRILPHSSSHLVISITCI